MIQCWMFLEHKKCYYSNTSLDHWCVCVKDYSNMKFNTESVNHQCMDHPQAPSPLVNTMNPQKSPALGILGRNTKMVCSRNNICKNSSSSYPKIEKLFNNNLIWDIMQFQIVLNNDLPLISPMSSWVLSSKKKRMRSDFVRIKVWLFSEILFENYRPKHSQVELVKKFLHFLIVTNIEAFHPNDVEISIIQCHV